MLNYFTRPLISKEGLRSLDNYAFHGVDKSWLAAHGLNDYWNWVVVTFVPMWVAPNVLTALGFLCQMVGFVIMSYYNADFETPVPAWVYFVCAGGLFAYQTLDNIDGKQARRTQSSSPLGELFDHVSDAMGVGSMIVTIGASCRVGPVLTLVVFFSVITPFFLYHWEEYFTGELILGEFDGPTESQCFVILLHVANGVFALLEYDFWSKEVAFGYNGKVVYSLAFCFLCLLSSIKLQYRMWTHVLGTLRKPFLEAFSVGVPFLTFFASALVYCAYSPQLLAHHRWDESRLLFLVLTVQFGYLTSRLIVQRVCKERAPIMYPISIPLFGAAVHAVLHRFFAVPHYIDPHIVLKILAAQAFAQCLFFFFQLNNELTSYLDIHTFRLKPKKLARAAASPRAAKAPRAKAVVEEESDGGDDEGDEDFLPRRPSSPRRAPRTRSARSRSPRSRSRSAKKKN